VKISCALAGAFFLDKTGNGEGCCEYYDEQVEVGVFLDAEEVD